MSITTYHIKIYIMTIMTLGTSHVNLPILMMDLGMAHTFLEAK